MTTVAPTTSAPATPSSTKWRLNISANNGRSTLQIEEIELRATAGGSDQCSGGTADASSEYNATYSAEKAFDNSTSTYWATASGVTSAWIEYTFTSAVSILEYEIVASSTDGAPKAWTLEYWNGSSWVVADQRDDEVYWSMTIPRIFPACTADSEAYRLNFSASNGETYVYIMEIEMRTSIGGADQCTGGDAFASSVYWNITYGPDNAFDNDTGVGWASASDGDGVPANISYLFTSAKNIVQYTIYANDTSAPESWTLEKWDGDSWVVIDTQTGQTGWSSETRTFTISSVTTVAPTTVSPTTAAPTTLAPTTLAPTSLAPTTVIPTVAPSTVGPTTQAPTTQPSTTGAPTTVAVTTVVPTTVVPSTLAPTSLAPSTAAPMTLVSTTLTPSTALPTTLAPTSLAPTTLLPSTSAPTTTLTTAVPTTPPPSLCTHVEYSLIVDEATIDSLIVDGDTLISLITDEETLESTIC